jgi:hypothetical protein
MTNPIAIILGVIILIIGMGTLIYVPMARLINIPGDDRIKAYGAK